MIFSTTQSSSTLEAAVPALPLPAQSLLLPFDNENGKSTGLALANVGNWSANVTLTFRSPDGSTFSVETLVMKAGTKTAFIIPNRFPQTDNKTGALTIATEAPMLAALGLRFLPEGTFTTLPVYVLGGFGQSDPRQILSHVVDGGTWQSAITLVNLDSQPADYQLRVFDNMGSPLVLDWSSKVSGTIAPLSSITLNTPGTASGLSEGWAEITSNRRLGAHLVFTQTVPDRPRVRSGRAGHGRRSKSSVHAL